MRAFFKQVAHEVRGLQCRSTVLMMLVVVTATGLISALYLRIATRLTVQTAMTQARMLTRAVALTSAEFMGEENRDALSRVAQSLLDDSDIVYVAFSDVSGRVLAASQRGQGQLRRWLDERASALTLGAIDRPTLLTDGGLGSRIDMVYPIPSLHGPVRDDHFHPVAGFVRIGVSIFGTEQMLAVVRRQVYGLAVGIALLMVPLGFAVMRRIVAPINALSRAANELAAGRLDTRVRIARSDEIGRLAGAFNHMAGQLAAANDELRTLNEELEQRVVQRTAQLTESNRLLKIEIADREEFVRAVSHDLAAPLRNVSGQTLLLRRKVGQAMSDTLEHCLSRIDHNVQYELAMIEELLELSRVRSEHAPRELVNLDERLRQVQAQLEYDLVLKRMRVIVERPLPTLWMERGRIRHLLQNLIDNAVKYTPAPTAGGFGSTDVHVAWSERPGEYEFRIADRGIGVRIEDRERIFNVFDRARIEYVSRTPGKGVGLAHCKTIVQRYGGRIWVEDNSGGGSVFCFTLKKELVAPPARERPAQSPAEGNETGVAICEPV